MRSIQEPGNRHSLYSADHRPLDVVPCPDHLENKIAAQAGEIERLAGENHRLATMQVALREDLLASRQELQKVKAHIRSIQTESDIQIRILLDKISKLEAEIRSGENVKNNLKLAHMEAQSLVKARQELTIQIKQASQELQKVCTDVKRLPDFHAELDNLRHELKMLRATFEYEKSFNIQKVEQMQAMEQNLIGMVREVEKLRAEVLSAEKRLNAPHVYGGGHVSTDPSDPPTVQVGGSYSDAYGRPLLQVGSGSSGDGTNPYGCGSDTVASSLVGGAAVSAAGGVGQ